MEKLKVNVWLFLVFTITAGIILPVGLLPAAVVGYGAARLVSPLLPHRASQGKPVRSWGAPPITPLFRPSPGESVDSFRRRAMHHAWIDDGSPRCCRGTGQYDLGGGLETTCKRHYMSRGRARTLMNENLW
jgi:hypothetical protein